MGKRATGGAIPSPLSTREMLVPPRLWAGLRRIDGSGPVPVPIFCALYIEDPERLGGGSSGTKSAIARARRLGKFA